MCTFCFCLFMLEKEKEKIWKTWKTKISKQKEKYCFLGGCEQRRWFLQKKWHFWKNRQTRFVFGRLKKTRIFVATICFGKMVLFCAHSKSPNTTNSTKIGVSAGTRENPKWHFWLQKCHFGKGPRKGLYYLWYLKAVLCWKHYFIVFSAKHSFAEIKECNLKKNKIYQK